jgi:exonuclease SbcD
MSIGQEHMLLLGSVANPAFDYVALGHIHKSQLLNEQPPVAYSGSLERLDFGDEDDAKGFYLVNIEEDKLTGQWKAYPEFHPVHARRFYTLYVDIETQDSDPTSSVLRKIDSNQDKIKDAIVRIDISLPAALSGKLRDGEIRSRAREAYYLTIARNIQRESRLRLGKSALEGISPEDALKSYLETRFPAERAKVLQEYGEKIIREYVRKKQSS